MPDAYLSLDSIAYAENFLAEDDATTAARARAEELGCVPISPAGGAALRLLATAISARHVVELGTGAGVSGLWLLAGMRADGVLTTVDTEPEHQRAARQAYQEAGIASGRYRLINGTASDVLPRLTDGGYDLVFIDADKTGYADYVEQAIRLLRVGGMVVLDNMLWHDRVADPGRRDAETVAVREVGKTIRADERLVPAMLPVGDGLLAAVKR